MTITCTLSIVYQGCDILRKVAGRGSRVREGLRLKDAMSGDWTSLWMPSYRR